MIEPKKREQWIFESFLVIVCLGLAALLHTVHGYWIVVLNLFFLPVALAGFYLGRYRAGVLALLCVLFASTVTVLRLPDIAASGSPLVAILAVAVWAAVLGLAALLIGTLSDERGEQLRELHEAYVGVVEVLSQYLQSAHPRLKAESIHVAELSQEIAEELRLSLKEIDDIRIASLLYNVGNIEITTKVIRRAVDLLEDSRARPAARPLQGLDLMVSLGTVLTGAVPLLLCQGGQMGERATSMQSWHDVPLGVQIIRAARAYVHLSGGRTTPDNLNHLEAVGVLRSSYIDGISPQVFDALQRVVQSRGEFLGPRRNCVGSPDDWRATIMTDLAQPNSRDSFRCPITGSNDAQLEVPAGKRFPVWIENESAGGFGVYCNADVNIQKGKTLLLHRGSDAYEVCVAYVIEVDTPRRDGEPEPKWLPLRIGLERLRLVTLRQPSDLRRHRWRCIRGVHSCPEAWPMVGAGLVLAAVFVGIICVSIIICRS